MDKISFYYLKDINLIKYLNIKVITSDNGVRSFQVSTPFPSGQMPWYMMAVWYASQHSGFLAVLGLIATSIMGLALTAMFKRHARKRLGSGDNQ